MEEILKRIEEKLVEIEKKIDSLLKQEKNQKGFRVSKKQIALVLNMAKERNISFDFLREITKEVCGVENVKDIKSQKDFSRLVQYLKNRT